MVKACLTQIRLRAGLPEFELHGTKPTGARLSEDSIDPTLEDNGILPPRIGQLGLDLQFMVGEDEPAKLLNGLGRLALFE
jgi:hypothetical protein